MSRVLAILNGNTVANVIIGELADHPGAQDVTDLNPRPGPGWARTGAGSYAPPAPTAPEPEPSLGTRITKLAFRQRLTDPVLVAIELASAHDPAATPQQKQLAATLRVMLENVRVATFIDLARPDTRAGVQQLQDAGLVPSAAAVLDAPVQPAEVPAGL